MKTLCRLQVGIEQISEAVERLNELASTVGLPHISIRCSAAKNVLHGENAFLARLYRLQTEEILREIERIEKGKTK